MILLSPCCCDPDLSSVGMGVWPHPQAGTLRPPLLPQTDLPSSARLLMEPGGPADLFPLPLHGLGPGSGDVKMGLGLGGLVLWD